MTGLVSQYAPELGAIVIGIGAMVLAFLKGRSTGRSEAELKAMKKDRRNADAISDRVDDVRRDGVPADYDKHLRD